ncbi:hypothetical protein PV797_09255 [Clostridiaceae bacterium M8S5]|nr:hypothetical protein PV797_09255 [Clostridiaceae bacterium M8S5]
MKKTLIFMLVIVINLLTGCKENSETWIAMYSLQEPERILLNFDDALKGNITILKIGDLSGNFDKNNYITSVSENGRYLWILQDNPLHTIYDLLKDEIIVQGSDIDIDKYLKQNKEEWRGKFSFYQSAKYIETEKLCWVRHFETVINVTYSPDKKYIAKAIKDEDSNYYIDVVDISSEKVIERVFVGETSKFYRYPLCVMQWHTNDYIVYTFEHKAYKYDVRTKKIIELGIYIFYPLITKDEKYMIYSKPNYDTSEESLSHLNDYGEKGVFIRDLKTNREINIFKDNKLNKQDFSLIDVYSTKVDYKKVYERN